ncbi:MAG: HEAT repeat domain-containing protein [Verrucomicrobiota bacterium]
MRNTIARPLFCSLVFFGLALEVGAHLSGEERFRSEACGGGFSGVFVRHEEPMSGKTSGPARMNAWRWLMETDPESRRDRVLKGLRGPDSEERDRVARALRGVKDPGLIRACVAQWIFLSTPAKQAVLDAHVTLGEEAVATVRKAMEQPNIPLRVAGLKAAGHLKEPALVPDLLNRACEGRAEERRVAREVLGRMPGKRIREALLERLENGVDTEKAVVLEALGARGEKEVADLLLQHLSADSPDVQKAALGALATLAPPEAWAPLVQSIGDGRQELIAGKVRILEALCQGEEKDRERKSGEIIAALDRLPPHQRGDWFPLLPALATDEAMRYALAAAEGRKELAEKALLGLADWPNTRAVGLLLERVERSSDDQSLKVLALRGAIAAIRHESDSGQRLQMLTRALRLASRREEKKTILVQLGSLDRPEALKVVMGRLGDPQVEREARLGTVGLAEKLKPRDPALAEAAARELIRQGGSYEVSRRAEILLVRP